METDNTTCPICTYSFSSDIKQEKSKVKCSNEDCSSVSLKNSDMCQKHNNKARYPILCLACNKNCCRLCYTTYFLTIDSENMCCIYCKKIFDIEFLLGEDSNNKQRFSKTFVWGELKEHMEKVYLNKVLAKIPKTDIFDSINNKIKNYKDEMDIINEQIEILKLKRNEYQRLINEQKNNIYNLLSGDPNQLLSNNGKCVSKECDGIIDGNWICDTCQIVVCSDCMEIKEEHTTHVCNKETISTIKFIKETSKPCPRCRTNITRTEGCDNMWCTNCHVFFKWTTCEIIRTGNFVHNPHFVEFLEKNNLQTNNSGPNCERNSIDVLKIFEMLPEKSHIDYFSETYRHARFVLGKAREYVDPIEEQIKAASVKYISNLITKEELSRTVQKYYKASKKNELANLRRETYGNTIIEIITRMTDTIRMYKTNSDKEKIHQISEHNINIIDEFIEITFESMNNIGKMFNSNAPQL